MRCTFCNTEMFLFNGNFGEYNSGIDYVVNHFYCEERCYLNKIRVNKIDVGSWITPAAYSFNKIDKLIYFYQFMYNINETHYLLMGDRMSNFTKIGVVDDIIQTSNKIILVPYIYIDSTNESVDKLFYKLLRISSFI